MIPSARSRILETAYDLFYRQGVQATGINQVIDEAGVAKATFYTHFPSKDDLAVAYLRERAARELGHIKDALQARRTPYERYISLMQDFAPWVEEANFRGCAFANIAAELADAADPIRREVKYHADAFRAIIRDVVEDLVASDRKYEDVDVESVTESYYLVARGAISASQLYRDTWPIRAAVRTIERLIP